MMKLFFKFRKKLKDENLLACHKGFAAFSVVKFKFYSHQRNKLIFFITWLIASEIL